MILPEVTAVANIQQKFYIILPKKTIANYAPATAAKTVGKSWTGSKCWVYHGMACEWENRVAGDTVCPCFHEGTVNKQKTN